MGLFRTSDTIIGRTMPLLGLVGAPNVLPAWVFQNQTGVLGTNLNGSVLYVGVSGAISVILPGTNLASVSTLSLLNKGTGYSAIANLPTICSNNSAQDLTVDITETGGVIDTVVIGNAAGSGYNVGDIITIVQAGGANGTATITAVNDGVPVSAQAIEFKGIPAGSILPVAVDYVTAIAAGGLVEADIIVGR